MTLLSKEFALLVALAFFVAVPAAYVVMQRWLEDFAYRVELAPWAFAAAGLSVFTLALLTIGVQALRVAASGLMREWQMKRHMLSPRHVPRWSGCR